jgi:hypothetical protein
MTIKPRKNLIQELSFLINTKTYYGGKKKAKFEEH